MVELYYLQTYVQKSQNSMIIVLPARSKQKKFITSPSGCKEKNTYWTVKFTDKFMS